MRKTNTFHATVVMLAVLLVLLAGLLSPQPRFARAQDGHTAFLPVVHTAAASEMLQPGTNGKCPPSGTVDLPPLSSALHVLPPLGENSGEVGNLDRSLTEYLTATVCEAESGAGCMPVATFTSEKNGGGLDYIKLQDHHYHVNWKVAKADMGTAVEIHFAVAGLDVGLVRYTPKTNRTVPVKFQIDNHPQIRARVLHEQGYTATELAQALVDEFGLAALETAWILGVQEDYSAVEVGQALRDVFALEASELALILKDIGYSVDDIYTVLTIVYAIDDACELDAIFEAACFPIGEYLRYTKLCYAQRFAPVLYFDGSYTGLPMSAEAYFQEMLIWEDASDENVKSPYTADGMITWRAERYPDYGPNRVNLCGRDDCQYGMSNQDFQRLREGRVPTYYRMILNEASPHEGRLRIAYWWFYGWQPDCSYVKGCPGNDGAHHGDWEHVLVTTDQSRTQAEYVTYYFHGVWYTRQSGYFQEWDGRPVVYVGKLGHGSYHSNESPSCWMLGTPHHCCQYADCRNPNEHTKWYTAYFNLVDLDGDSESWLAADRIFTMYEYKGEMYEIVKCLPNADSRYQCWTWGPVHAYCDFGGDWCSDWEHNSSCGTHPTKSLQQDSRLDWEIPSCSDEGCYQRYCEGLTYTHAADFNMDWPWGNN